MTNRAYIRISTTQQTPESQRHTILEYCKANKINKVKTTIETVSGAKDWNKRELAQIVEVIKEGDILIVSELSRLGRSMLDLLEVLQKIKAKGGIVHTIKENLILSDDGNIGGKMLVAIYGIIAELERDLISQRVRAGQANARARGVRFGQKKGTRRNLKLDPRWEEIIKLRTAKVSCQAMGRVFGVHGMTVRKWLKRHIDKHGNIRNPQYFNKLEK